MWHFSVSWLCFSIEGISSGCGRVFVLFHQKICLFFLLFCLEDHILCIYQEECFLFLRFVRDVVSFCAFILSVLLDPRSLLFGNIFPLSQLSVEKCCFLLFFCEEGVISLSSPPLSVRVSSSLHISKRVV